MASLADKTIVGVLWNIAEQFMVKGISVFVTLILAHFLSPEDFGLLAMMIIFINISSSLMESGFRQALIRLPNASQNDFNTAFYANIILAIISYGLLFLSAPVIARFYDEEQLILLIRVAGLVVIINAFQVVQYACLSRALNFKAQFRAALPAGLFSAVIALAMAYNDHGVWALVAQMLASAFFVTAFLWLQNLWHPSLSWSKDSLKSMYQFGYRLFLSGLLDAGFKNMYLVVIAKLFTVTAAGLYFFADRIKEILVYQLVGAIQKVTYPALSSIQMDVPRLKRGYKNVISIIGFIIFPLVLIFASLSEPLFHVFLPEKWWPSIVYLQLMCIATVLIPIQSVNFNILKVLGRSDLVLKLEILKKTIAILILVVSFRYGVIGILLGQIISAVLAYIPYGYYSKKMINYSIREQLSDFIPVLSLAFFIALLLWFSQQYFYWNELTKLVVLGAVGPSLYLAFAKMFKIRGYELTYRILKEKVKGTSIL